MIQVGDWVRISPNANSAYQGVYGPIEGVSRNGKTYFVRLPKLRSKGKSTLLEFGVGDLVVGTPKLPKEPPTPLERASSG